MSTSPNQPTPSAGAMRAAEALRSLVNMDEHVTRPFPPLFAQTAARVIDRETHVAELVATLEKATKSLADCQECLRDTLGFPMAAAHLDLAIEPARAVLAKVRTP